MSEVRSFKTCKPVIKRIDFRKYGFMAVELEDGRVVQVPLSSFPDMADLTANQRRQYSIIDDTILMFRDDDEVYHIQDFLGTYETNAYRAPTKEQDKMLADA